MHVFSRLPAWLGLVFGWVGVSTSAFATEVANSLSREVRAHAEFLADDLLEGRGTGTRGYALAAHYVAAQFARIGLQPMGDNGSYAQAVTLSETIDDLDAGIFVLHTPEGAQPLEAVGEALVRPSAGETTGSVRAPAVFVGYGVQAPELNYDDYRGVEVKGKIVITLAGAPPTFPNDHRAHYSNEKAQTAVRNGAIGMITVVTPEYEKRYPWAFFVAQGRFPRMRLLDREGNVVEGFPQLKATATVSRAASEKLFAAASRSGADVFAVAEKGEAKPFALGAEVELAGSGAVRTVQSANIVGQRPGSDPALAGEPIVFTGHLDHGGIGPAVNGDTIYNGAMDNAVGIGVMIALAERMAAEPAPRRPVIFAALTAEEKGLLGAEHLARNLPDGVRRFAANVNVDMALFPVPVRDVIAWGAEHTTLGATVEQAAAKLGFTLSPDPLPAEVIFVRSDQYAFVRTGVPAVFLSSGQKAKDPQVDLASMWTAFLRERYHKPSDDLQQPIDWPSAGAFGEVCLEVLRSIAQAEQAPRWHAGNFFGERFDGPR